MEHLTIVRQKHDWYDVQGPYCQYAVKRVGDGWLIVQKQDDSNFGVTAGGHSNLDGAFDTVALLEGVA